MLSVEYSESIAEVLDILEHTNKADVDKISPAFIEFLKANTSKEYKPNLDHTKRIKDMNLKEKTIGILSVINSRFWCTDEEKIEFNKVLKENEIKYQEQLKQKYNTENLFKNRTVNLEKTTAELILMIEYKESVFTKIINKIKKFFIDKIYKYK